MISWQGRALKLARLAMSEPPSGETVNAFRALAKLVIEHAAECEAEKPKKRAPSEEEKRRAVVELVATFIPGAREWAKATARRLALEDLGDDALDDADDDAEDDDDDGEDEEEG